MQENKHIYDEYCEHRQNTFSAYLDLFENNGNHANLMIFMSVDIAYTHKSIGQ